MKLWIDDVRPAPEGYVWCKSTLNALHTIYHNADDIEEIALDHDAGEYVREGGDFIKVLEELERLCHSKNAIKRAYWLERCIRYRFSFHSANPVGVANMRRIIERNGWEEVPHTAAELKGIDRSRCDKCVYELYCSKDKDKERKCPDYKRDAPDGGYYR